MKRNLFIIVGALLVLAVGAGLAFASDSTPTKEPESSPFFEATLQQAVDELDGKARAPQGTNPPKPTENYTVDHFLWPECDPEGGYTRNVWWWPQCHFTSDPNLPECDADWPTKDYTWDSSIWPECGEQGITSDSAQWCDPSWTADPTGGIL